jgi:hypothetical protein
VPDGITHRVTPGSVRLAIISIAGPHRGIRCGVVFRENTIVVIVGVIGIVSVGIDARARTAASAARTYAASLRKMGRWSQSAARELLHSRWLSALPTNR